MFSKDSLLSDLLWSNKCYYDRQNQLSMTCGGIKRYDLPLLRMSSAYFDDKTRKMQNNSYLKKEEESLAEERIYFGFDSCKTIAAARSSRAIPTDLKIVNFPWETSRMN